MSDFIIHDTHEMGSMIERKKEKTKKLMYETCCNMIMERSLKVAAAKQNRKMSNCDMTQHNTPAAKHRLINIVHMCTHQEQLQLFSRKLLHLL
jgi:hypothetical protein